MGGAQQCLSAEEGKVVDDWRKSHNEEHYEEEEEYVVGIGMNKTAHTFSWETLREKKKLSKPLHGEDGGIKRYLVE